MKLATNRLYDDLAYLWPLLSQPEEYAEAAAVWRGLLRRQLGAGRHPILELGVGGGHGLSHLTADFEATAVDLSEPMLAHSRMLNPDVEHHLGDMRSVRLGRKFKAVLIHDAIGYMQTAADLAAAFASAAAHLEPGGVFLTCPEYVRETFRDPQVSHRTRSDGETELTFIEYDYDPDPDDTKIEAVMTYFIRRKGTLRVEHDRHVMGLFPMQTWLDLMREAGFRVEPHPYVSGEHGHPLKMLVGEIV